MRPRRATPRGGEQRVSIHAPWEGCDRVTFSANNKAEVFQFTHPGKGATGCPSYGVDVVGEFQFTHPGKGATDNMAQIRANQLVSIHAPWEGCDSPSSVASNTRSLFQFTHPGKGATARLGTCCQVVQVSIHAPWEGCDWIGRWLRRKRGCFNSRTLGRVRRGNAILKECRLTCFNSRTLGRVRLITTKSPECWGTVSIHAPWEGCDWGLLSFDCL